MGCGEGGEEGKEWLLGLGDWEEGPGVGDYLLVCPWRGERAQMGQRMTFSWGWLWKGPSREPGLPLEPPPFCSLTPSICGPLP